MGALDMGTSDCLVRSETFRNFLLKESQSLETISSESTLQNVRGGAVKKAEKLRELLEESGELQGLRCPLPLDPKVHLAGLIPQECSVFKSALSPLRLTFRTAGDQMPDYGSYILAERGGT